MYIFFTIQASGPCTKSYFVRTLLCLVQNLHKAVYISRMPRINYLLCDSHTDQKCRMGGQPGMKFLNGVIYSIVLDSTSSALVKSAVGRP